MKQFFTLLFLALQVFAFAATGDTTIIVAHAGTNLNSPPSNDDNWVVFPSSGNNRQIIMKFTLGCGTPNCSGWDYTVNTSLGKKNGIVDTVLVSVDTLTNDTTWAYNERADYIELGRLITPYGTYMANNSNGYNNTWTHPYYYDVTDYANLLRDSVSVRVHYDGWTDAFSAQIEFIMIEGAPTRTVNGVQEIYNTYINYPNSNGFESVATAKQVAIPQGTTSAKLLLIMTGHGSQGEFDPHSFQLSVNGTEVGRSLLWNDKCGFNPIAPQGGTWIFSRANWCPGEKVPVYEYDITPYITAGQNASIDLDFDDFAITQNQSAGYGVSLHLITYTTQHRNDVMMEEIIAPNSDKPYLHWNPISTQPKVKIKNMGTETLTYAEISYKVSGGSTWYYEWRGSLPSFHSEEVALPAFDWNGMDSVRPVFEATASWPNNQPDEFTFNNTLNAPLTLTPKMDSTFILYLRTNNRPQENWYLIKNEDGDTVVFKNTFAASFTNRDTIRLSEGSYALDVFDYGTDWECGDGLSFFVNLQNNLETAGQIRLMSLSNQTIKTFNPDFGANIHYEFTVGYKLGFNPPKQAPEAPVHSSIDEVNQPYRVLNVFPNPATDQLQVQLIADRVTDGELVVTDVFGRVVYRQNSSVQMAGSDVIPTAGLSTGLYQLTWLANGFGRSVRFAVAH